MESVDIPSRIFRPEPTFWPSERQEKLLLAALGSATQASQTWRALQSDFVLDELEPGSFDLMALIYRRLYEAGYHDSVVERLKGIYRREWVRANVMLERSREVAGALAEAGVDSLFVEGSPLSERFYPSVERGLPGMSMCSSSLGTFAGRSRRSRRLAGVPAPSPTRRLTPSVSRCSIRTAVSASFARP